jgi:hypothetical protein
LNINSQNRADGRSSGKQQGRDEDISQVCIQIQKYDLFENVKNGTAFHDFIETVFREFAALTLEENESMGQIIPN